MAASDIEAAISPERVTMRKRTTTVSLAALATLVLTGCSSTTTVHPTPIPRAESTVQAVDVDHLPELNAPATCSGYVALTFDDGPTQVTKDLLDILGHYDVPAAFFNLGLQEKKMPELVERQIREGHQVGNHTMTHPELLTIPLDEALDDIDAATVVHRDLVDHSYTLFRPPYGGTNQEIRKGAEERNMTEVLWTVDSKDYEAASAEQVIEQSQGMTDGGILLMHDGKPPTVEALPQIIRSYYDQGLCFGQVTTVDEELPSNMGTTHRARATEQEAKP
ncbi:polysaccharide deacetylase family protein [Citricoccus nitrophenolicus]|uniref:Polysaccharide deacetylase family protein n=1 Tax=Citricoccus nitrophenolicus TaxID=863575 RepID=A0ABV0ILI4_9MICC